VGHSLTITHLTGDPLIAFYGMLFMRERLISVIMIVILRAFMYLVYGFIINKNK